MSQAFKKEVEKGLVELCQKIEFKKKKYYFIKPDGDNIVRSLHFGMSSHKKANHIFVDITVGIAHKNIELLYAELVNIDKTVFKPTISLQIGYLMPGENYYDWDFSEEEDNKKSFEEILDAIRTYGFEYQEKLKAFQNLFEAFEERSPGLLNQDRDRYLPILYYLKGEKQKGLDFIKEAIERQKTPMSEEKSEFLKKLAGTGGQVIVGSGVGKVDPEYLKFAENYKVL